VFSDDSNDGKFFTKQSKTKAKGISNAIVYGVSIIVIYVLLG
jgi:thiol:disulfide interchange protein DsbD